MSALAEKVHRLIAVPILHVVPSNGTGKCDVFGPESPQNLASPADFTLKSNIEKCTVPLTVPVHSAQFLTWLPLCLLLRLLGFGLCELLRSQPVRQLETVQPLLFPANRLLSLLLDFSSHFQVLLRCRSHPMPRNRCKSKTLILLLSWHPLERNGEVSSGTHKGSVTATARKEILLNGATSIRKGGYHINVVKFCMARSRYRFVRVFGGVFVKKSTILFARSGEIGPR